MLVTTLLEDFRAISGQLHFQLHAFTFYRFILSVRKSRTISTLSYGSQNLFLHEWVSKETIALQDL